MFGDIAIRETDRCKHFFGQLIHAKADDAHLRSIPKAPRLAFKLVLRSRAVNESMASLTERHQVIGAIPASLARLDVMDIEHGIFRLALTPLTHMTISGKDIFPDI